MSISFSGLSSGIDTNNIVSQLVALERLPITKIQQRQKIFAAHQDGMRDLGTKLTSLRTALQALRDPTLFSPAQTVTSSDDKILSVNSFSNPPAGGYSFNVTNLARAEQRVTQTAFTTAAADDTLQISIGGGAAVGVSILAGDSLQMIADKVNGGGTGVYATVSNNQLYFASKTTGAANTIGVSSAGSLATDMGMTVSQSALDANYTLDGVAKTSSSNIVSDGLAGVTFTLKSLGSASITASSPAPDSEKIAEKLKSMIDAYNDIQKTINAKTTEKPFKDPKTDNQRALGVFFGDSTLTRLAATLRKEISHVVGGLGVDANELVDLGIGVPKASSTTTDDAKLGLLTFDKAKFTAAFQNNPDAVKLFLNNNTNDPTTEGITQYMERIIKPYIGSGSILQSAIDGDESVISNLRKQETRKTDQLNAYEKRLLSQFAAMEKSLGLLQRQQAGLTAQMGMFY